MSDLVPGVNHIDLHEGRLLGSFDLPPADMAHVRYEGRVMFVVVADIVSPFGIVTTKDGDIKAKWTCKAVDVALVRDEGMQTRLSDSLHMIGVDDMPDADEPAVATGPKLVGVYDAEGTFLGYQADDAPKVIVGDARLAVEILDDEELSTELIGDEEEVEFVQSTPETYAEEVSGGPKVLENLDDEDEELHMSGVDDEMPYVPLAQRGGAFKPDKGSVEPSPQAEESFGKPIVKKDRRLQDFLYEREKV